MCQRLRKCTERPLESEKELKRDKINIIKQKTMKRTITIAFMLFGAMAVEAQELQRFEDNGKYGYKDAVGKVVIPPKYDVAYDFSEGLATVGTGYYGEEKYGYIDKIGKIVIPLKYESAGNFTSGLAVVGLDSKYGLIDKAGNQVVPFKYDYIDTLTGGLTVVALGDKYGFIDQAGKEVVPLRYGLAETGYPGGLALVEQDDKWGFVDQTGKIVIPLRYDSTRKTNMYYDSPDDLDKIEVYIGEKSFLINTKGECIKDCDNAPENHPKVKN